MKKLLILLIIVIFLVSCSNLDNSNKVTNENKATNSIQKESVTENKDNSKIFQMISKEDILKKSDSDYESVFLSLDGKKIDLKSLNLIHDELYPIDNNNIYVSETILKPIEMSSKYKVSKGMTIKFNGDGDRVFSGQEISNSLKNTINRILPFNDTLKINFNISDFNFDIYDSKIVSIYFYPIVYQINNDDNIYYILKGKHLIDNVYMDGFVELRFFNDESKAMNS